MNTKSVRNMMAVVGLTVGFATASLAQDAVHAVIGFPFVVQGTKMNAGSYNLKPVSTNAGSMYLIQNTDTGKGILVKTLFAGSARYKESRAARLTFQCVEGEYCALKQVWDGTSQFKEIRVPGKSGAAKETLTEIAATRQ